MGVLDYLQSGLGKLGGLASDAWTTYENAMLGPGGDQLTPEQRSAALWRGRILGAGRGAALGARGLGQGYGAAQTAAYTAGALRENQTKRFEDYLDQQIAAAPNDAERQRLTLTKLLHQVVPPDKNPPGQQARSRTITLPTGESVDQLYSARTGEPISSGKPYRKPTKGLAPATEAKNASLKLTTLAARQDLLGLAPEELRSSTGPLGPLAAGPRAAQAKMALTAYPGESEAEYKAFRKQLADKLAPPAAEQPAAGPSQSWGDMLNSILYGQPKAAAPTDPNTPAPTSPTDTEDALRRLRQKYGR